MTTLSDALASAFARLALANLAREFPRKIDHLLLAAPADLTPRRIHPVFFGSDDWHSAVHMRWRWENARSAAHTGGLMRNLLLVVAAVICAGCGVETASTAATAARIKQQEMEQAKKTQQRAQQKIDQATEQMQQRAQQAGGDATR